jgi:hypothetical protein
MTEVATSAPPARILWLQMAYFHDVGDLKVVSE